jgi:hypothetical protein
MINKVKGVAIVLVVCSFFLFYLASANDFDFMTEHHDTYDTWQLNTGAYYPYEFGAVIDFHLKPYNTVMQHGDYLTIDVEPVDVSLINGTMYIVLWESFSTRILKYSEHSGDRFLNFGNSEFTRIAVAPKLAYQYPQKISTTITLHHYERPHWLFFGAGIIIALIATVMLSVPRFTSPLLHLRRPTKV